MDNFEQKLREYNLLLNEDCDDKYLCFGIRKFELDKRSWRLFYQSESKKWRCVLFKNSCSVEAFLKSENVQDNVKRLVLFNIDLF